MIRSESFHAARVAAGKLGGRPRQYDLSGFTLGQSITFPWRADFTGNRRARQTAIGQGVRREEKRLGQKFSCASSPTGVIVTRVE